MISKVCMMVTILAASVPISLAQDSSQVFRYDRNAAVDYMESYFGSHMSFSPDQQEAYLDTIAELITYFKLDFLEYKYFSLRSLSYRNIDHELAIQYGEKAIEGAKKNKDIFWEIEGYNNLGVIYSNQGFPQRSMDYLTMGLLKAEEYKNPQLQASLLSTKAQVYNKFDDYSLDLYREAHSLVSDIEHPNVGLFQYNTGVCFLLKEPQQLDSAILYMEEARSLLARIGSPEQQFHVELADAYYQKGALQRSEELLATISPDTSDVELRYLLLWRDYLEAKLSYEAGEYDKAIQNINRFKARFDKGSKHSKHIIERLLELRQIADDLQKKPLYYRLDNLYTEAMDSLYSYNSKHGITVLESREALYQKDKIIAQRSRISNLRLYLLLTLLGLVLLGLSLYNLHRRRQKAREELAASVNERQKAEEKAEKLEVVFQNEKSSFETRELSTHLLHIIKKNEILEDIGKKVDNIDRDALTSDVRDSLDQIKRQVISNIDVEDHWETFFKHFKNIHPSFYSNLHTSFPDLTPSEKRLLSYLKMNLSSKEIAQMTGVHHSSIHTARYRLKKKLGLEKEDKLEKVLADF